MSAATREPSLQAHFSLDNVRPRFRPDGPGAQELDFDSVDGSRHDVVPASIALHDEFRSTASGDPRDHAWFESGLQVGPHVERHRAEAREYDDGPERHREAQCAREVGRPAAPATSVVAQLAFSQSQHASGAFIFAHLEQPAGGPGSLAHLVRLTPSSAASRRPPPPPCRRSLRRPWSVRSRWPLVSLAPAQIPSIATKPGSARTRSIHARTDG